MSELGATHCADTFQSTYYMKDSGLLLTLYVDDMILSGPSKAHASFWQKIQKFIEIEEPKPVSRVWEDITTWLKMNMEKECILK